LLIVADFLAAIELFVDIAVQHLLAFSFDGYWLLADNGLVNFWYLRQQEFVVHTNSHRLNGYVFPQATLGQ